MMQQIKIYFFLFLTLLTTSVQAQRTDGHNVIYEMNIGMFTSQGTFTAAQAKLSELHDLGVDIVWLMPIYPRGSSKSPYAVTDYKGVNPNYGTLADLKSFVTTAHNLGMQVWLDWVPNHTANEHPWVSSNRAYYGSRAQPSTLIHPNNYSDVYQLNYNDDGLKNAMNDALKYWIDEADVDGYRFDYVSSSTILGSYWIATNPMLKSYKTGKNITLLAEADARDVSKIRNNGSNDFYFDYDYAWWFQETVLENGFGSNGNVATLKSNCETFVSDSKTYGLRRMVYLTNHDQNWNDQKTLTDMYGDNRYALTVLTFTLYGMPLLYNGQEVGGNQMLDYFNDTKITWTNPDSKMQNTVKKLCAIKHNVHALHDEADVTMLTANNDNVLAYQRAKDDSRAVVVLNLGSSAATVTVSGITAGTYQKQLDSQNPAAAATNVTLAASQSFTIPARGYLVYTVGETQDDPVGPDDPDDPMDVYTPTLDSSNEVSIFFETATQTTYYVWAWNSATEEGSIYSTNGGWPGDAMQYMGQNADGKYIYKYVVTKTTSPLPDWLIVSKNGGDSKIYDGVGFVNHGYYVEGTNDPTQIITNTGIKNIGQSDNLQSDNLQVNDAIYDLSGRKIVNCKLSNGKLPKGIYIKNGKKFVVK